ncbi:MAG: phosphatase PAP2 family protein [Pseudomonadota bacterium]
MAVLAAAGLAGLDQVVATALAGPRLDQAFATGIGWLDLLVGKEISTFLLGFAIIVVGAMLLLLRHRAGWPTLFVGIVQFSATVVADLAKPVFGRLRPGETPGPTDRWFADGNSFPSGHSAFYLALVLPVVLRHPRLCPLLGVPMFVAVGRVVMTDHYFSDVAVSLALAAVITAAAAQLLRRRLEASRRGFE